MLLQGAAVGVRVLFALWSLQGAPVRVLCALWGLVAGPAAGCRCRVLVSECCARWKKHVSAAHEYLLLSEVFAGVMFF